MSIRIPADVTIVTLRANGRELDQRFTEDHATDLLETASDLLSDRADIEFSLGVCERVVEEMPTGTLAEAVDEAGYHYLASAHRAGRGVRILMVDKVARRDLGGQSRHQTRVCLVAYGADVASTSRMLAHELGHLLELGHPDSGGRAGPGQERQTAAWMRNLMYSGALNPASELTPDQVRQARSSTLARRFGGP